MFDLRGRVGKKSRCSATTFRCGLWKELLGELGDDARPLESKAVTDRYLMDAEAVKARAEAVARQASGG